MQRFCTRCVMPIWDESIQFGRPGLERAADSTICVACDRAEKARSIDWNARWAELVALCDRHRRNDGSPDVLVPVSGGKDSHVQVHILRQLGMHPLLLTVRDCFGGTKVGADNLANLERLACGLITWRQNPDEMKKMSREAFEKYGCPTWPIDLAIYSVPPRVAAQLGISLIVYGENISWTYGGSGAVDTPSAMKQIKNDVVRPLDIEMSAESAKALEAVEPVNIEPIYLSYYMPWDGYKNYRLAQSMGFQDASKEWHRRGFIEDYDQIDSVGYCVHPQLKWFKFGSARVSDVCSNLIRCGYMTREAAVKAVRECEGFLDERAVADFCHTLGYAQGEFWQIARSFANKKIFRSQDECLGYGALREDLQIK